MTHTPTGDAETIEGLRRELADERLRSTVFERQYRQACSDHASVMAELDNLRTCLIAIRRRTIFGPSITTSDLLDLTSDVAGLAAEKPQCVHAPTYDAGLCCGHPDDCTFVSPPKPASRLCDCERGHNGIGIVGRECDCGPAAEFATLRESLAKAEEARSTWHRLAIDMSTERDDALARAAALQSKVEKLAGALEEMKPHVDKIERRIRINDEMGRVVIGQTESAAALAAIFAEALASLKETPQ